MMKIKRIYDLSVLTEESASDPLPASIEHIRHQDLAEHLAQFFDCSVSDFPDGLGYAQDKVAIGAHTGTHLDAPWHYFPISEGRKAKTIDEVPLEWCIGNGVVLDMRHKPRGSEIAVPDLEDALRKIEYEIQPGDIVMMMTGADKYWGKKEYFDEGCGMGRESTLWLIDKGVRVMGIDAWTWDRPFWAIKEDFKKTGNKEILWAGHRAGIEKEYCHIEKLANLDQLPMSYGFTVVCFPVKLAGGSAGWTRVAAIFEEE